MNTMLPKLPHVSHRQRWLLTVTFLLCVLVYLRGLFGGFLFDDFGSIVDNPAFRALDGSGIRWLALALSSHAGLLRRPISMLSFGIDYSLFGLNPLAFKLTNLAIHMVNGALVYSLSRRIVPRLLAPSASVLTTNGISLLVAALWLLHPLNVSNVVYIVQRENLLASSFILAGLICYAEGRMRILYGGQRGVLISLGGLVVFGLLAVFSKENGALIVAYALVMETICFKFSAPWRSNQLLVRTFFWLTVALPVILFLGFITIHPQWLANAYAGRSFTLAERLLSETRILCDYLMWIFLPLPSWMGIFHDDIATSTGVLKPATTLFSILFLIALIAAAWKWRHKSPGLAFGAAWFLIGHSMESTLLPLELAFEHRNYLPMAGLFLGMACAIAPWVHERLGSRVAVTICCALVLTCAGLTAARANTWGDPLRLALVEVANHPHSARAQYEAGRRIIFNASATGKRDEGEHIAIPYFERAKALDPTDLYSASSLILIHSRSNGEVPPEELDDLARRAKNILQPQVNPFLVVLTAATQGNLKISPAQMQMLVYSALENKCFPPTMRAMILNDYGHYLLQIAHDNQRAVSLTLAAAAADPKNPLFQINLAKLALALNEPAQALMRVEMATKLNKAGLYNGVITVLRQRLKNFDASRTQPNTLSTPDG
jgi:hypothetical protein